MALRQGRRITWVEDALAPLRGVLPAARFRELTLQIAAAAGIETFVWLVDVGGTDRDVAASVITSMCGALLEQALQQARGPAGR